MYILLSAGSPVLAFRGSAEGDETAHGCKCQPTQKSFPKPGLIMANRVEQHPVLMQHHQVTPLMPL